MSINPRDAVIVDFARSPMGRSKNGCFRHTRADELSAEVIKGLLARNEAVEPEEIDDLILLNSVCVEHNSFDVLHVSVVLESTAIESNLFAHLSNLLAVVLSENVKFENSFSNIWGTHEIDLKNFSLKVSFVLSVTFKSF